MPENGSDTLDLTALHFWQWGEGEMPTTEVDVGIPYDSLHPPCEVVDTVFRKSLFRNHSLQVKHTENMVKADNTVPAWIFVTLLLLTGLTCLYYHLRGIKITELGKALMDRRALDRIVRDCNLNRSIIMLPMGLLLTTMLSLPIHQMAMANTGLGGYLLLTLGLGLLYIVRNGVFRLLGNTFENKGAMTLYITNNYLYHLAEATVVCVLLYPFHYLPGAQNAMAIVILGFVGLSFVWRFIRGVKVFLTLPNGSSFYLFYYLCIVEIIPLLVALKWFIVQ